MKLILKYYTLFIILFLSCEKDNAIATIDCEGTIGGLLVYDECGDCKHPQDPYYNSECIDCEGTIFGDALLDNCNTCDNDSSNDCVKDCEGTWGGTAFTDACNRCVSSDEYSSVDSDEDGLCDGIDFNGDGECDICTDIDVPISNCNSSNIGTCACYGNNCDDCVDFYIDECGVCNGTGVDEDDDGVCDDIDDCLLHEIVPYANNCGECNGHVDQCGICNGNGLDEDQDGLCDNIDTDNDGNIDDSCLLGVGPNENGILDDCDVCGGETYFLCENTSDSCNPNDQNSSCPDSCITNNNYCDCNQNTYDCIGVCDGDALIDACGDCYNYVTSPSEGMPELIPPKVDVDNDGLCDGTDADGDGNCDDYGNGCDGEDSCPNDPDNDIDNDGICGDIDACFGDDNSGDPDNDSICDDNDTCPLDSENDIDGDGICGDIDVCPYDSDDDIDNDGVCGDIDTCPSYDDNIDTDSDGVADGCDVCPDFDDTIDTDTDGVADGCDVCPDFDDTIDTDTDGVADGCDTCPLDAENDADSDGVCGDVDTCPDFDDTIDADTDGVADGCDTCPEDADNDLDSDGICGNLDTCPNDPDNDSDADSICDDVDDCIGNIYDECGVCNGFGIADGECDCDGNTLDCNNVCNGSATLDCNNTCEGPATIDECGICSGYTALIDNTDDGIDNPLPTTVYPSVDFDDDGECDGTDADGDGECDADENGNCDGEDTCIGNIFDECEVCNGTGVDDDDDGICDDIDDCIGSNDFIDNIYDISGNIIGDPLLGGYDICGICNGNGVDIDNDGLCDNYDVDGDGSVDDTCIDTDSDNICDHIDSCWDLDGDDLCENNNNGNIEDDCIGSNNFPDNTYDINGINIEDSLLGGYDQCGVCNGDGTSCLVETACDLPSNTVFVYNNSEIWYNVNFDITSFTFILDTNIINVSGGNAETEGFIITSELGGTFINGGGSSITAGCGILTNIDLDGNFNSFTTITLNYNTDPNSNTYVTYCDSCIYGDGSSGTDDGGSDDGGTDDGGATDGGSDDGGTDDGGSDGGGFDACTLSNNSITLDINGNVYYNVDFDIGGFQWTVDGTTVNSVSGGDAESSGFTVQAGGPTVLGFSFTGSYIPAGCGTLTQMVLAGNATGLINIVFSNSAGLAVDVTYENP